MWAGTARPTAPANRNDLSENAASLVERGWRRFGFRVAVRRAAGCVYVVEPAHPEGCDSVHKNVECSGLASYASLARGKLRSVAFRM